MPRPENWDAAKAATSEALRSLPAYTPDRIVAEYEQLLHALADPVVREMSVQERTFTMHQRFQTFALAYSSLFNLACRREKPLAPHVVRRMLDVAAATERGDMTEEKARGTVLDIAEGFRRLRDNVGAPDAVIASVDD